MGNKQTRFSNDIQINPLHDIQTFSIIIINLILVEICNVAFLLKLLEC